MDISAREAGQGGRRGSPCNFTRSRSRRRSPLESQTDTAESETYNYHDYTSSRRRLYVAGHFRTGSRREPVIFGITAFTVSITRRAREEKSKSRRGGESTAALVFPPPPSPSLHVASRDTGRTVRRIGRRRGWGTRNVVGGRKERPTSDDGERLL